MSLFKIVYEWWLDGYPPDVKTRILNEKKRLKPKKSLRQRLHEWWMSGYPSYEGKIASPPFQYIESLLKSHRLLLKRKK